MNPFKYLTGPVKPEADAPVEIGTPTAPLERPRLVLVDGEIRDAGAVKTGRAAQTSAAARWKNFLAKPTDERDNETLLPSSTRDQRRDARRTRARQMRKGQRNFVRREWAKETAARDLLNLFLLADGAEPASPLHRYRAQQRLADRVAYLRGVEQGAYDQAIAARQQDRSLPAPSPVRSHDEIRAELWRLAQTSTLPTPKVKQARPEQFAAPSADTMREYRTLGRTGRAG